MSSWFSGGGGNSGGGGPNPMDAAKTELELFADLFNKMSDVCFKKCIGRMKESDLQVGEMSCADRCVGKYLGSLETVAACVARVDGQMKQQAEAAQNMMKFGGGGAPQR